VKVVISKIVELHEYFKFDYRTLVWFGLDYKLQHDKVGYSEIENRFLEKFCLKPAPNSTL
jgi:hypothetical protein